MNSSTNRDKLDRVADALGRVDPDITGMVFSMARSMSEMEAVNMFNQAARDLFAILNRLANELGKTREFNIAGYQVLFENAVKINATLTLDKFTLIILEYAPEIYRAEEDFVMNMEIPDTKVNVNNEFGIIRSQMFKDMWKVISKKDQDILKDNITTLTNYAHVYFIQKATAVYARHNSR